MGAFDRRLAGAAAVVAAAALAPLAAANDHVKETVPLGDTLFGLPRYNPNDDWNEYEGGFDVSDKDYLASTGFNGAPGFIIAILIVVVMILMILVKFFSKFFGLFCKCCNGAFKPRYFTATSVLVSKVLLVIFCLFSAVSCFLIYAGGPQLVTGASDATDIMIKYVNLLDTNVTEIDDAFVYAEANSDVTGLSSASQELVDALTEVKSKVNDNEDDIKNYMEQASLGFIVIAAFLLLVVLLGGAAGLIGMKILMLIVIILASILLILTWIFFGVVSITAVVADDLCTSMEHYVDDPAKSDLSSVIPCLDEESAIDAMNEARRGIVEIIESVNDELIGYNVDANTVGYLCEVYATSTVSQMCGGSYYSGPYADLVCGAYDDGAISGSLAVYPDEPCPYPSSDYRNYIGNFGTDYASLRCSTNNQVNCAVNGQINADSFDDLADQATAAQAIIDVMPPLESLIACTFVNDAFAEMVESPCDDMTAGLMLVWAGFLYNAVMYLFLWVTWIVMHSRLANPEFRMDGKPKGGARV